MARPPSKRELLPSKRALLDEWLAERRPARIGREEFGEFRERLGRSREKPASSAETLALLLETDLEIDRSLGGFAPDLRGRVHTKDRDSAADSLGDLSREYTAAREGRDALRAEDCRRAVMRGKQRLKLVLSRKNVSPEKLAEKQEILDWFLVWLENPAVFPAWIEARRRLR